MKVYFQDEKEPQKMRHHNYYPNTSCIEIGFTAISVIYMVYIFHKKPVEYIIRETFWQKHGSKIITSMIAEQTEGRSKPEGWKPRSGFNTRVRKAASIDGVIKSVGAFVKGVIMAHIHFISTQVLTIRGIRSQIGSTKTESVQDPAFLNRQSGMCDYQHLVFLT